MEDIEFLVPEFEHIPKSAMWYLYFGLVVAILIITAILSSNYLFIGVIALGAILIIMRNERQPQMIMFAIHDDGIYLGNKMIPYSNIKNYSIFQIGGQNYFILNPIGKLQTPSRLPVTEPGEIRAKLNNLLTEVEYQESLLDALVRVMGL